MNKPEEIVIRGKLHWAKVLGAPRPHTGNPKYDKGPYWSVDVTPDKASLAKLSKLGVTEKLREPGEKDDRTENFLSLRVLATRPDGTPNLPPRIYDARGQKWDEQTLIGNESIADVKVRVVDYGKGVDKGVYLQALRILDHVPYVSNDFAPLSEEDEFFAAPETTQEFSSDELDDEVPA